MAGIVVSISYLILTTKVRNLSYNPQVWRELFSPLHALNFGIGGDTTCNVLWRLQNGELENIRPKVRQASCVLNRCMWDVILYASNIQTFTTEQTLAYTF